MRQMDLGVMREIVKANVPYDTGFLFTFGTRYNETDQYLICTYDVVAVPYITYLEEGTQRSQKHKGFISVKTIAALNSFAFAGTEDINMERSSMVTKSVVEHIIKHGKKGGGPYERYTG